jgi:hypothetical protein
MSCFMAASALVTIRGLPFSVTQSFNTTNSMGRLTLNAATQREEVGAADSAAAE